MNIKLSHRKIIKISGRDSLTLLNNISTNDINKAMEGQLLHSLILTPQGKILFDFFIMKSDDDYLLSIDAITADIFIKKINMYKLGSDVQISETDMIATNQASVIDNPQLKHYIANDSADTQPIDKSQYLKHKIINMLPDINRDIENCYPLYYNLEYTISFSKGCYIGQEVTARMKYRAKIKKHLKIIASNELGDNPAILDNGDKALILAKHE